MIDDPRARFIRAAVLDGSLDDAQAVLSAHPEIAGSDIFTAALLGDDALVRDFIAHDPQSATAVGTPLQWDALTHLCFSVYFRLDRSRSNGFVNAARALLEAGANANTGFFDSAHRPHPAWESALYAAAGVAHHAVVTRLLLEHGADPNDEEVPYHSPETNDNAVIEPCSTPADSPTTACRRCSSEGRLARPRRNEAPARTRGESKPHDRMGPHGAASGTSQEQRARQH